MANLLYDTSKIVKASSGNPGAVMAMTTLVEFGLNDTLDKILSYGITGTDFYVLFSDLCGRNPFKVQPDTR